MTLPPLTAGCCTCPIGMPPSVLENGIGLRPRCVISSLGIFNGADAQLLGADLRPYLSPWVLADNGFYAGG